VNAPPTRRRGASPPPARARTFERHTSNVPRLALTISEAAEALGVSVDFLSEHVASELRWVRRGRKRLVSVTELQAWLDANAERVLE
jgi:excisionase family DNA binding protein